MRTLAVIPARLESSRCAHKIMRLINGKPMLHWVYDAAYRSNVFDELIVAVESVEAGHYCRDNKIWFVYTSPEHENGTSRVWEVAKNRREDVIVNIQADEPMMTAEHYIALLDNIKYVAVTTLGTPIKEADVKNPNCVKVVTSQSNFALWFSRSPLANARKHQGIYAYHRESMRTFCEAKVTENEKAERLEQLRLIELNIPIYVAESPFDTIAVDTEDDLAAVEAVLGR